MILTILVLAFLYASVSALLLLYEDESLLAEIFDGESSRVVAWAHAPGYLLVVLLYALAVHLGHHGGEVPDYRGAWEGWKRSAGLSS